MVVCWHSDDGPAAHGTNLDLEEPAAEAGLMEDVLTVGDLHEGVGIVGRFIEGLQADTTVMVLGGLRVEHVGQ